MEILRAATEASSRSDRVLFIVALIILGLFAIAVMKYFVKQTERLTSEHARGREQYHESLMKIVEDQHKLSITVATIVERNTVAMNANSTALSANTIATDACIDELKYCRETRARHRQEDK